MHDKYLQQHAKVQIMQRGTFGRGGYPVMSICNDHFAGYAVDDKVLVIIYAYPMVREEISKISPPTLQFYLSLGIDFF